MNVVITNNVAGATGPSDKVEKIRAAFAPLNADTEIIEADGSEITNAAHDAAAGGARVVVAAGGDGTVNSVAAALTGRPTPLGILPLGTLNHFARDIGVPLELADAAALVVNGTASAVDVGTVNDRIFLNNSSIGAYPLMVREREAQRSRLKRSKWWAMFHASIAIFKRFPKFGLRLFADGETALYRTPAVMVGNNIYALDMSRLGTRERIDAGLLSVYAVRARTRWQVFKLLLSTLYSKLEEHTLFDVRHAERVSMQSDRLQLEVSLDGEVVSLSTPLEYSIRKRALLVIAP